MIDATVPDAALPDATLADAPTLAAMQAAVLDAIARAGLPSVAPADIDAPLLDLGVDSLALAELAAELEMAWGVTIDDKAFAALTTVRAIAEHLTRLRGIQSASWQSAQRRAA